MKECITTYFLVKFLSKNSADEKFLPSRRTDGAQMNNAGKNSAKHFWTYNCIKG